VTTTADTLVYLTPDHRYVHADGHEVPSVSKILRVSGLRPGPFAFARRGQRRGFMEAGLRRGTEVHRLARAIDETGDVSDAFDDDFDPADLSVGTANYVAADLSFRDTSGYEPIAWEKIVYHPPPVEFAGKIDSVGWFGTRRILIDRKTDRALHKSVYVQLSAYRRAWAVCHPNEQIDRTYALHLKDDMTFALLANPIEDEGWLYFAAAYWMHKWRSVVI
jgi:hypothetical protein